MDTARRSDQTRLHADLTILANLAGALARTRAVPLARGQYPVGWPLNHPRQPPEKQRLPRRPRHFEPERLASLILFALALIGVMMTIALLVLGLLIVHVVTDHFRID
jgi:hypothetical protein